MMLRSSGSFKPDGDPPASRPVPAVLLWVLVCVFLSVFAVMLGMIASAVVVALRIIIAGLHGV